MARFITVHPDNPQQRLIDQVVERLRDGELLAYPTDSGYALGCTLDAHEALEQIRTIRHVGKNHHFTVVCSEFGQLGHYVRLSNANFRALKAHTPGPYTFILPATKELPRRMLHPKKHTIGVRIPDHTVARAMIDALGEPLVSSSLILPGESDPLTEGWVVEERIGHLIPAIVDADVTGTEPTSVIDLTGNAPVVAREGAGDISAFQ
ncbi:MAG: L-threonylcarbamoyladenylate synthase [Dermabacter sp.]|nr:L-threonylcarbamoyladenylate synthase [Dermabacter sp.]